MHCFNRSSSNNYHTEALPLFPYSVYYSANHCYISLLFPPQPPGLKNHSILYRKCLEEGRWQYTVMDDTGYSCVATMETGVHSRDDPLKGLHNVPMKIGGIADDRQVVGVSLNDKTLVKRI